MTPTLRHISRSTLALAFTALLLGGCSERRTDLLSGTYQADVGNKGGDASTVSWKPEATLVLDMDALKVTIDAGQGLQAFTLTDEGSQHTGDCAAEIDAQWATLTAGTPVIDGVTFHAPVLFTRCGSPSPEVYLGQGPTVPAVVAGATPWLGFALVP